MKYVEKYRSFAKAHPVAQSLIYGILIAAVGLSGAGGGAAVLGLLKMTDKLLQGEKFSTALGQGIKTGGLAAAAGQFGQLVKGDHPVDAAAGAAHHVASTMQPGYQHAITQVQANNSYTPEYKKAFIKALKDEIGYFPGKDPSTMQSNIEAARQAAQDAARGMYESVVLSAALVKEVLDKTTQLSVLYESWLGDKAKAIGGAVAGKAQQVGHNLTTKVTANKLKSAWTQAGSPTDSNQLAAFLKQQGVADSVVQQVFKSMKIKLAAPKVPGQQPMNIKSLMSIINTLNNRDKKRILTHLHKNLGTA
jgi:hypothetical protein